MNLDWTEDDLAFRQEVRDFLEQSMTPEIRHVGRHLTSVYGPKAVSIAWQKILHAKGWVAPAYPVEYGGTGWDLTRRYIFASECARAGTPPLSPMGLGMCGPVLLAYGTPEQKARFLPPMLAGDEFWCQGYSEPGSGSDLATLQMSAREDGDDYVCNGHKIWTTHANVSDWIFCLVRTAQERVPQLGITFLLIDMRSPGVEVRPIISLSGEHIQNEIFFTDVRVPKANVVGEAGQGWTVAKYLMEFERGGSVSAPGLAARVKRLQAMIQPGDDDFAARVAQVSIEVEALSTTELRVMSTVAQGGGAGPASSLMKTVSTELSQRIAELALEATGLYAMPFQPHSVCPGGPVPGFEGDFEPVGPERSYIAIAKYLNDRAGSIYAGTNEIQRNIMAKTLLGLGKS